MGKSAPSAPAVPSAAQTAAAQGQANTATAATQAALNYVDQYTPYGSTVYSQNGSYTNPQGDTVPTYAQTTTLSPMGQQILSGQENVTNTLVPTAQQLATQAATTATNPLTLNAADQAILNAGPQQINQQAANAIYNQQASFLTPQWNQQQQQLQDQLSRQGISVGSDAYNNAMTQLDNARTQAFQSAQDSATAGGAQSAANLFGLAQSGQNQQLSQQQMMQQQPLALLSELSGATPATPSQPIATPAQTSVAPTDVVGATSAANSAAMAQYQAQLAQQNSMYGGLASLGAAGIMAYA